MVSQSHSGMMNHMEHGRPMQMQYVPQQGMQQIQVQQVQQGAVPANVAFAPQGSVRMVQTIQPQPGQQYVIAQSGQQLAPGQSIPVTVGPNGVLQPRIQQGHGAHPLHQLDGNGGLLEEDDVGSDFVDAPCSSNSVAPKRYKCKSSKKNVNDEDALRIARDLLKALQMDGGGGGGMSDSSSDEEEVDEDDDPIRRIADRIGDGQIEDGEQAIVEEDPLNSGDDQSDDEDLETLFDADNVIMCQFEKVVHRARSKWKFQLKDGIMHIDNKDYCFQKCSDYDVVGVVNYDAMIFAARKGFLLDDLRTVLDFFGVRLDVVYVGNMFFEVTLQLRVSRHSADNVTPPYISSSKFGASESSSSKTRQNRVIPLPYITGRERAKHPKRRHTTVASLLGEPEYTVCKDHLRGHEEDPQFACESCEKKFMSRNELRNHKRRNCMEPPPKKRPSACRRSRQYEPQPDAPLPRSGLKMTSLQQFSLSDLSGIYVMLRAEDVRQFVGYTALDAPAMLCARSQGYCGADVPLFLYYSDQNRGPKKKSFNFWPLVLAGMVGLGVLVITILALSTITIIRSGRRALIRPQKNSRSPPPPYPYNLDGTSDLPPAPVSSMSAPQPFTVNPTMDIPFVPPTA
ncbi:zinc finger, C2H2 type [Ancylostoma ceylanicum]|uniref:Zinc finger, C2H2 type n=1 Tax=Ancylostoma ceylanicum TaxID=53326 RepID=A0A0D6LLH0_9BILA|nr:zinc finger, C2H2 type [Ancylostoma ceylanicum]